MLVYLFFRVSVFIFRFIPFALLYKISDGLSWLLYKVIKYRQEVIITNLKNSFPEKSEKEREEICRKSYTNLSDIILESFKSFSMSEKEILEKCKFLNPELINNEIRANGHSLQVAAHYANWELIALAYSLNINRRNFAFYKPLSNKYVNDFSFKNRISTGLAFVPINKTSQVFKDFANKETTPSTFILVSDQSPISPKSHWVKFLNQDTACLRGADVYARLYNLPVYYIDIQRVARGFYTVKLNLLTDTPRTFPPEGITQLFMSELETIIRRKPEDWLWSHKRWKTKKKD